MSVIHELCSQILHGSCECEKEDHFLIVVSCLYSSHSPKLGVRKNMMILG